MILNLNATLLQNDSIKVVIAECRIYWHATDDVKRSCTTSQIRKGRAAALSVRVGHDYRRDCEINVGANALHPIPKN